MSAPLSSTDIPKLAHGVRLRHDEARGLWVLLAPERVLQPDPVGVAILGKVDGVRSLATIVDELADSFAADRARIATDVGAFLAGLVEKGLVEIGAPSSARAAP